ncbi:MAG TPA: site-specific integrase [Alphaproteobacteria bacterium]|nr:site-specific integrase [Alphaproteobacteria bacterium]
MATLEKRLTADGTIGYRAKVRLKGFPSQSATFERKTDAREWAKQTEASMREGRYFKTAEAKKHTVADLIDRHLREIEKKNPKRFVDVRKLLNWWRGEIGPYLLSDLTRALIIEQRDKLLSSRAKNDGQRSPATVNRYMMALGHALTIATNEWEWIQENPMKKISNLPEPRGRVRYLNAEERERLLQVCKASTNPQLHTLVVLALSTGARYGELIKLRWDNIDWDRKVITLHDTKNKERRLLPLMHYALELMEAHNKARNMASDLVFPSPSNPMRPWNSRSSWLSALQKANIQNFRFHDLRHSCASYLAMNGASLAEIAEVLGHKTLQMVKRYAHLSEAHTAKVVQRMNERIFG